MKIPRMFNNKLTENFTFPQIIQEFIVYQSAYKIGGILIFYQNQKLGNILKMSEFYFLSEEDICRIPEITKVTVYLNLT